MGIYPSVDPPIIGEDRFNTAQTVKGWWRGRPASLEEMMRVQARVDAATRA
jgi:hypothetical protein